MKNSRQVVLCCNFFVMDSLFPISDKVDAFHKIQMIKVCKGIQDPLHAFGIFQTAYKAEPKGWRKGFALDYFCAFFPFGLCQTRIFKTQTVFGLVFPASVDRSEERRVG